MTCPCQSSTNSYQLLVWQRDYSCGVLFVNSSSCTRENTSLLVEVKKYGLYQITVFSFNTNTNGILNAEVILLGNWTINSTKEYSNGTTDIKTTAIIIGISKQHFVLFIKVMLNQFV